MRYIDWARFQSKIRSKIRWLSMFSVQNKFRNVLIVSLDPGLTWSFQWYKTSYFALQTTYWPDWDFVSIEGNMLRTTNNKFIPFPSVKLNKVQVHNLKDVHFWTLYWSATYTSYVQDGRKSWRETEKTCSIQACHWISLQF